MDGDIMDAYNQTKLTGISMTITARSSSDNNHFVARVMEREAQVLTPKRTEFGKQVRKAYESGEYGASRHDLTKLEPKEDGISNTLTSVQKDNIVMERAEAVAYDDYNGRFVPGNVTNALTGNIGSGAERNGRR